MNKRGLQLTCFLLLLSAPAVAQEAPQEESSTAAEAAEPTPAENAAPVEDDATPPPASSRTFQDYARSNPGGSASPAAVAPINPAQLMDTGSTYPRVEWHGYFRFRADSFWNLDLDTAGTSPILPPIEALLEPGTGTTFEDIEIPSTSATTVLDEDGQRAEAPQFGNAGAEHLAGANVRFRLRPIFHVTQNARIHVEMNILDNLVLGSTPDGFNEESLGGLRTDLPLMGFTRTQEPLNVFNSGRNSISVTQAYAEVKPFFGNIRVGRMASHWGLGLIANGSGSYSTLREPRVSQRGVSMQGHGCMDCDFGDYVDRAQFTTQLFNTYLVLGWDYNYSGPTDISLDEYYGQARELSNYDDVRSYLLAIFQRPLSETEVQARNERLNGVGGPRRAAFDWGLYTSYRTQRLSAEGYNVIENELGDDLQWIARGARAVIPDLWFRLQANPSAVQRIRLEGEFAGIVGSIDNAQLDPGSGYALVRPRQIRQFGGALEFEFVNAALATGLNTGFATGRTIDQSRLQDGEQIVGFGVLDQFSLNNGEPKLTNFQFDRNYFVDMIMFREIIGTITNAVYFNPFFQYDLFARDQTALGVRADVIGGFAMAPETTPSGEGFYGIETDIGFYWQESRFMADLTGGLYLPGSAFDGAVGRQRLQPVNIVLNQSTLYEQAVNATPAWTLQGRMMWAF